MIYLIPVASVSTDTPTLILCRLLLDTLSRLYIVPYRVELLSHAQSLVISFTSSEELIDLRVKYTL